MVRICLWNKGFQSNKLYPQNPVQEDSLNSKSRQNSSYTEGAK